MRQSSPTRTIRSFRTTMLRRSQSTNKRLPPLPVCCSCGEAHRKDLLAPKDIVTFSVRILVNMLSLCIKLSNHVDYWAERYCDSGTTLVPRNLFDREALGESNCERSGGRDHASWAVSRVRDQMAGFHSLICRILVVRKTIMLLMSKRDLEDLLDTTRSTVEYLCHCRLSPIQFWHADGVVQELRSQLDKISIAVEKLEKHYQQGEITMVDTIDGKNSKKQDMRDPGVWKALRDSTRSLRAKSGLENIKAAKSAIDLVCESDERNALEHLKLEHTHTETGDHTYLVVRCSLERITLYQLLTWIALDKVDVAVTQMSTFKQHLAVRKHTQKGSEDTKALKIAISTTREILTDEILQFPYCIGLRWQPEMIPPQLYGTLSELERVSRNILLCQDIPFEQLLVNTAMWAWVIESYLEDDASRLVTDLERGQTFPLYPDPVTQRASLTSSSIYSSPSRVSHPSPDRHTRTHRVVDGVLYVGDQVN